MAWKRTTITITAPDPNSSGYDFGRVFFRDTPLPYSYSVRFYIDTWGWAVYLNEGSNAHLQLQVSATGQAILSSFDGVDTYTELSQGQDGSTPTAGDMEVVFREFMVGDSMGGQTWHAIALWANKKPIMAHAYPVTTPLSGSFYLGLGAINGESRQFKNLHVPELSEFSDWISLDPNESPMGGLSRSIEGRYINFFIRPTGEIRAWIPKATSSVKTYNDDDIEERHLTVDQRGIKTHVRQHGAYVFADYIDPDLVERYGHLYTETNNPYLMTERECRVQAELHVRRLMEQSINESAVATYNALIELEDHVTTPTGERIVTGRNVSFEQSGEQVDSLDMRGYVLGS